MSLDRKLKSKQVIKRLALEHIAPYKNQVFIAIFFMIVSALCSAAIVRLVKPAIDEVFVKHDREMLVIIPFVMFGIYTIKGGAEYFQSYIIKYIGQKILTNMQVQMYDHLLKADFLFIQSQSSGRLISRFTNDIILMRGAVSNMLVRSTKYLLSVLFLIIIMFNLDPYLSSLIFLAFPLAMLPIHKLGNRMRLITNDAQEELSNFTAKLDETFYSVKVIKSFCAEKQESEKVRAITDKILSFYKRSAKFDSLTSPIMEVLSGLTIACILLYGGSAVINEEMTTGALFAFITAFVYAYRPFKSLLSLNVNLQEGIAAANRVFNILDLEPKIKTNINALKPQINKPEIEFRDLSVKFGDKVAIETLNVKISKGKTFALVGRSGSGKTTLANILVRFFDPESGQVLIDNIDIKQIAIEHLRKNISMVTQDIVLFNSSIADNIAYGLKGYSREDIIKAAKFADAHDFINELPKRYDTMIGSSGSTLSGGQRQKIAIARAFLKQAPILILDEATSALDPNSEHSIINSITNLRKNKTTLIITHRLSSITQSDQIIVMKKGGIIEQGTHNELLKMEKEYYKLYNKELKESSSSV